MKCIDCDYFGNCEKAENVCEKYRKTIRRNYTRLKNAENENFEFQKMEVENEN